MPASRVAAPLIAECRASLECRVVDRKMMPTYCFFLPAVVKAWVDVAVASPRTLYHRGPGVFMVAGRTVELPSRKKRAQARAALIGDDPYFTHAPMRSALTWRPKRTARPASLST
jgi:hypothetical protein